MINKNNPQKLSQLIQPNSLIWQDLDCAQQECIQGGAAHRIDKATPLIAKALNKNQAIDERPPVVISWLVDFNA